MDLCETYRPAPAPRTQEVLGHGSAPVSPFWAPLLAFAALVRGGEFAAGPRKQCGHGRLAPEGFVSVDATGTPQAPAAWIAGRGVLAAYAAGDERAAVVAMGGLRPRFVTGGCPRREEATHIQRRAVHAAAAWRLANSVKA